MKNDFSIDKYAFLTIALIALVALFISLSTLSIVIANENSNQENSKTSRENLTNRQSPNKLPDEEKDLEPNKIAKAKKQEKKAKDSKMQKQELLKPMEGEIEKTEDKVQESNIFKTIPILGFHDIVDENNPKEIPPNRRRFEIDYSLSKMEKFLEYLIKNNFWFLTSDEFFNYFVLESKPVPAEFLNRKPVFLTFDDGYKGMYTNLLPLLEKLNKKYGVQATVTLFINPGLMKVIDGDLHYVTCEEIEEGLQKGYFDIQSHGLTHLKLTQLQPKELSFEMAQSKMILRQCLRKQNKNNIARFLAYPYGAFNQSVQKYASRHYAGAFAYNNKLFIPKDRVNNKFKISRIIVNSNKSVNELIALVNNKVVK